MSQVLPPSVNGKALLGQLYEPIGAELAEVEEILRRELRSEFPFVDELVKHGFRIGGKRLRPALVLLAGQAAGSLSRDHLVLGAVVEMIHTATLVHDDVLDEASVRRHLHTVNARWGNEASVLLGDYLFTHSFYLASTLDSTFACRAIGRATNIVCEGELRQIHSRGRYETTEDEYLSVIEAKTAELTSCCCLLGAHYAAADADACDALARFGRQLGIAFQIVDDLLDVLGDEAVAGKSLGSDLDQGKPTLPVIRLLEHCTPSERQEVLTALASPPDQRRRVLQAWWERTDGLSYARDRAATFAASARTALEVLPRSPARAVLERMTEFVVERTS
jgi:octaprenyl-diphosphate synthase